MRGSKSYSFFDTGFGGLEPTSDEDLAASRVYDRAIHCQYSKNSLTSTASCPTALSVFPNLGLSQLQTVHAMSCLSVYAVDLNNRAHYVFGKEGAVHSSREI